MANVNVGVPDDIALKNISELAQGSGTYTVPDGVYRLHVKVKAGGGGGGGCGTGVASSAAGCGGGEGGEAEVVVDVQPGDEFPYVVGAGGGGGASGGGNGSSGGNSTFGSPSICTATAGAGGSFVAAGSTINAILGGDSGIGTVGDVLRAGAPGGACFVLSGIAALAGYGGGPGGVGRNTSGAGNAGKNWGGGGAGACSENNGGSFAGGDGKAGRIVVYEYGA